MPGTAEPTLLLDPPAQPGSGASSAPADPKPAAPAAGAGDAGQKPAEGAAPEVKPDAGAAKPGEQPPSGDASADKAKGDPPADAKPAEEVRYDLKLPEGSQLTQANLDQTAALAKELGLSNEAAQRLVDHNSQVLAAQMQALTSEHVQRVNAWGDQVRADQELGGDRLQQTVTDARRALDRFATPEFLREAKVSGYLNHPEVVRVFARIGKAMGEAPIVPPSAGQGGQREAHEILYTHTPKN